MKVGVDYYPEQCDPSYWPADMELMVKLGVSVVRMAEFAWSRIEPEEGKFDFSWLDQILDRLQENGIVAILGTPTATPPAWLHARFPDIYPADQRKYRLGFGTREQRCLNNDDMRAHSERIVKEMVKRYGTHPAVIGWQTDNEFSANLCYCSTCASKFRDWLRKKYQTLEALNAAWGTTFWSQTYTDWSQVPLPWQVKCGDFHNPSLQLEFRRFQSETTVNFQRSQIDIIRRHAPHQFVTHNLMGLHNSMDYFELARDLDFVSWDNYPINPWVNTPMGTPLAADIMRGLKQKNVWVMEQQSGVTGWNIMGRRPPSGWLRCAAWQTVAHGADAVVFFRWRSAHHGTEQYWQGIIDHDGKPRARFRELAQFAREMHDLSQALDGSAPRSEVAIVNAYDQHFAMDIQPQAEGLKVWDQVGRYYAALRKQAVNVDIVPLSADLTQYKLVIAPSWYILTEKDAECFSQYVRQGGTLIMSPRTGVKDSVNACRREPLPTLLRDLVGVEIDDFDAMGKEEATVCALSGEKYRVSVWADSLLLGGATEPLCHYEDGTFAGAPAIAKNKSGAGAVYYFGTFGEPALYDDLLGAILSDAGIETGMSLPEGVDAYWREKEGSDGQRACYLFLMNFNGANSAIRVPAELRALAGAKPQEGSVTLPPYGVGIYEMEVQRVKVAGEDPESKRKQRRTVAAK